MSKTITPADLFILGYSANPENWRGPAMQDVAEHVGYESLSGISRRIGLLRDKGLIDEDGKTTPEGTAELNKQNNHMEEVPAW